ncbi:MAG: 3-octaprenyl-4-hydroxybenzoate carboxy-lyase, partial [Planctomycetales bacterium]|nr:3-octaprenyl-4-hydroxybenzoate carboxy-lyase [Planctomycetales bacterium]
MSRPLVVAITGASGAVYAARLLQVLLQRQCELHVTISPSGRAVVKQELDV